MHAFFSKQHAHFVTHREKEKIPFIKNTPKRRLFNIHFRQFYFFVNNRLNSFVIQNKLINKIKDRKRFINIFFYTYTQVSVFFVINKHRNKFILTLH